MGGPFYYHIHENPVNTETCEDVGGHFDPYQGLSECPVVGDDAACQVGDLSGKHGWINTTCFQTVYFDPYLSLNAKDPAYIVGKSVVLHRSDQSKFACANINIATREQYKQLFDVEPESPTKTELEKQSSTGSAMELQPGVAAEVSKDEISPIENGKRIAETLHDDRTAEVNGTIAITSSGAGAVAQWLVSITAAAVVFYVSI